MKTIDFPDSCLCFSFADEDHEHRHKGYFPSKGVGCVEYGERFAVKFKSGAELHHNNPNAFTRAFPQGYFGVDPQLASMIVSAPAVASDQEILFKFTHDNGTVYQYRLFVQKTCS